LAFFIFKKSLKAWIFGKVSLNVMWREKINSNLNSRHRWQKYKLIYFHVEWLLQTMLVVALFAAALAAKDRPLDQVDPGNVKPDYTCQRGCLCNCARPPTKSPFEEKPLVAKSAKMAAVGPAYVPPIYYACPLGCFCDCGGPPPTLPYPTRAPPPATRSTKTYWKCLKYLWPNQNKL
jgi:hypothetical protein